MPSSLQALMDMVSTTPDERTVVEAEPGRRRRKWSHGDLQPSHGQQQRPGKKLRSAATELAPVASQSISPQSADGAQTNEEPPSAAKELAPVASHVPPQSADGAQTNEEPPSSAAVELAPVASQNVPPQSADGAPPSSSHSDTPTAISAAVVVKQEPAWSRDANARIRRAKQAARMAYGRTMELGSGRRMTSTEKIPTTIADKLKAAPHLKEHYFDLWMKSKCNWGLVQLFEKITEWDRTTGKTVKRWLDIAQLNAHYLVPGVGDAIAEMKSQDPKTWRPNPDCPEFRPGRQYLCEISAEVTQELVWEKHKCTELQATLEREAAESLLPDRISKPQWMWDLGVFKTPPATLAGGFPTPLASETLAPVALAASAVAPLGLPDDPELQAQLLRLKEQEDKKAADKAARDQARSNKVSQQKAQREQDKTSPKGLAKALIDDINKEVVILVEKIVVTASKSATGNIPAGVVTEYQAIFKSKNDQLDQQLKKLKQILATGVDKPDVRSGATKMLQASVEDRKKFKKLASLYNKEHGVPSATAG